MYFPLYFTEGGGYDPWGRDKNFAIFIGWLQCYNKPEMKNMGDHNKRTVFYCGDPGPMVPKGNSLRFKIGTLFESLVYIEFYS